MSPKDINMRIPESVRKCVVYLGIEITDDATGVSEVKFKGTGFIVSVPTSIQGMNFHYVVTAKHVAVKLDRQDAFFISANSKDGGSRGIKAETKNVEWHYPEGGDSADVAVITLGINLSDFDIIAMPIGMFIKNTDIESLGVGPGDEVIISGLFSKHPGKSKNMPIIRTGNIAMIPDEPIPVHLFGDMDAYLIEARSIGGLSGSPVILLKPVYLLDDAKKVVTAQMYLLGLIHGHWDVPPESIIDESDMESGISAHVNMGIAIVVPAQKIIEIIEKPKLREQRNQIVRDYKAKNYPTQDDQK
jgi:hypothetical protein